MKCRATITVTQRSAGMPGLDGLTDALAARPFLSAVERNRANRSWSFDVATQPLVAVAMLPDLVKAAVRQASPSPVDFERIEVRAYA